jgi:hypothetical protein
MNTIYRLVGVIALFVGALTTVQAQVPGDLTSTDGGFHAVFPMPSEPSMSSAPINTAIGEIMMYTYMTTDDKGAAMIAYVDYPTEAFEGASLDAMLDSARAGAMRNLNAKVTKQTKITIDGHPGRSVYFTGKSNGLKLYGRFDYYLVTPRLFQVGYLSINAKDVNTAKIKAYFNSFELVESGE